MLVCTGHILHNCNFENVNFMYMPPVLVCFGCVLHCCISATCKALILSVFLVRQFVLVVCHTTESLQFAEPWFYQNASYISLYWMCTALLHLCNLQSLNFISFPLMSVCIGCVPHCCISPVCKVLILSICLLRLFVLVICCNAASLQLAKP
jgi:hypothetical protein